MENRPIVSIILPVYNSRNYVRIAIESILAQTYQNFELIIVDDGSTDSSKQICDEYAKKDSRIIVCHQENSGICKARNVGIKLARGYYIGFSDHDDYIKPEMLSLSIGMCLKYNADLVKFGKEVQYISTEGKLYRKTALKFAHKVYNKREVADNYLKLRQNNVLVNVWDGLFKKDIIDNHKVEFDPFFKIGGEDYDFCNTFSRYVNTLVTMDEILYIHYVRNGISTSSKTIPEFEKRYFVLAERLWRTLQELKCNKIDQYEYANLFFESFVLSIIRYNLKINNKDNQSFINIIKLYQNEEYYIKDFNNLSLSKLIKQSKKFGLFSYLYFKKHYSLMLALIKCRYKILK